jgi:hypothetical protein
VKKVTTVAMTRQLAAFNMLRVCVSILSGFNS